MEDPTISLISPVKSFDIPNYPGNAFDKINTTTQGDIAKNVKVSVNYPKPLGKYVDISAYKRLQKLKSDLSRVKDFTSVRDKANPYFEIGNSISTTRTFVKLANIDAVFGVTGKTSDRSFNARNEISFLDIAGGPGGFTQYIQHTFKSSRGYGITLSDTTVPESLRWDHNLIDTSNGKFKIMTGASNVGDIYKDSDYVGRQMKYSGGVDFIVADGAISVNGKEKIQEQLNTRIQIAETNTALMSLKYGGNFVLKVYDLVTKPSMDLLYILSNVFDSVYVFKPITSRPANSEKYVVCIGYNDNGMNSRFISILSTANREISGKYCSSIVSWDDEKFEKRMHRINTWMAKTQSVYVQRIIDMSEGVSVPKMEYSLENVFMYWDIPSSDSALKKIKLDVYDREKDESILSIEPFEYTDYADLMIDNVSQILGSKSHGMKEEIYKIYEEAKYSRSPIDILSTIYDYIGQNDESKIYPSLKVYDGIVGYINNTEDIGSILFLNYIPSIYPVQSSDIYSKKGKKKTVKSVVPYESEINEKYDAIVLFTTVMVAGLEIIQYASRMLTTNGRLFITMYPGPLNTIRYSTMSIIVDMNLYASGRKERSKYFTRDAIIETLRSDNMRIVDMINPQRTIGITYTIIATPKESKIKRKPLDMSSVVFKQDIKQQEEKEIQNIPVPSFVQPRLHFEKRKDISIEVPMRAEANMSEPNILKIKYKGKNIIVIQEAFIPGGTLTRGVYRLMETNEQDVTYIVSLHSTSPQLISVAYSAMKTNSKSIIVIHKPYDTKHVRLAESMGANIVRAGDTIKDASLKVDEIISNTKDVKYVNLEGYKSREIKHGWRVSFANLYSDVVKGRTLIVPVSSRTKWMVKDFRVMNPAKILSASNADGFDIKLRETKNEVPFESDVTGKRLWSYITENINDMDNVVMLNKTGYYGVSDNSHHPSVVSYEYKNSDKTPSNTNQYKQLLFGEAF